MKRKTFFISLLLVFAVEMAVLIFFVMQDTDDLQNAVAVNEAVQSVQADWDSMKEHENRTNLDYVVLDGTGNVVFQTKSGLSTSVNEAVIHRDTILEIENGGRDVGKIIIYNNSLNTLREQKKAAAIFLAAAVFMQCVICMVYGIYLNRTVIRPFGRLKGFAERVAGGNLDIPLEMDRQNLFGAFTESFDIMRAELKAARRAEAEANASKKELVAQLSHDIKTPVASIKAAAEVGAAFADNEKTKDYYEQIICKSDQINVLITDLFTSALEELNELSVTPDDMESAELKKLLENADYLHYAAIPKIPDCLLYTDRLRLQQVFDNILANSYKYADTKIDINVCREDKFLAVIIEDYGGGVSREELPLIKEKFKRGNNTKDIEGAGLGLYISDYFMNEMHGILDVQNGQHGLKVIVRISYSGVI